VRSISATELARNTRQILDDVASRGESVAIERNHVPVARIVPSAPTMTAAQALHGLRPMLTREEGLNWLEDSRGDFDQTVRDPWA
jgi:antitoxin (DNA-binding transcriptional repressor) of toxin-antitoxin stability system